eukprot:1857448-Pyramimonas_sp.AAC.1
MSPCFSSIFDLRTSAVPFKRHGMSAARDGWRNFSRVTALVPLPGRSTSRRVWSGIPAHSTSQSQPPS